jgi:hypothetical protein
VRSALQSSGTAPTINTAPITAHCVCPVMKEPLITFNPQPTKITPDSLSTTPTPIFTTSLTYATRVDAMCQINFGYSMADCRHTVQRITRPEAGPAPRVWADDDDLVDPPLDDLGGRATSRRKRIGSRD